MSLMTASIIVILAVVILAQLRDSETLEKALSGSVSNEVLTTVTEKGENLAGLTAPGSRCTVSAVTNKTSATAVPAANYTTTNRGCTIAFTVGNSLGVNNSDWNVTYTYTYGDTAYTRSNDTITGFGSLADFWTIIVLAIIASVVIGLILYGFGGKKAR